MPITTCTSLTANTPRGCLVRMGTTPKTASWPRTRSTTTMTGTGSATGPGPRIATEPPCPGRHGHKLAGAPAPGGSALDWHEAGTRLSPRTPLPSPSSRPACSPKVLGEEQGAPHLLGTVTPPQSPVPGNSCVCCPPGTFLSSCTRNCPTGQCPQARTPLAGAFPPDSGKECTQSDERVGRGQHGMRKEQGP